METPSAQTDGGAAGLLLIVEDNPADLTLFRLALKQYGIGCKVHTEVDGEAATQFIDRVDEDGASPCPVLAILDLNLPRLNGVEVLRHLRASHRCREVPVIVASSSTSQRDSSDAFELGASAYFSKPSELAQFLKIGALVSQLLHTGN